MSLRGQNNEVRALLWLCPVALALIAEGCQPLATDAYHGEPLYELVGTTVSYTFQTPAEGKLLASIFWSDGDVGAPVSELHEHDATPVEVDPSLDFRFTLYKPPEDRHLIQPEQRLAMGTLLVYHDRTRDGAFTAKADQVVGQLGSFGLLYASAPTPAAENPLGIALPEGYSAFRSPFLCSPSSTSPKPSTPCSQGASSLGKSCRVTPDCGPGGYCLRRIATPVFSEIADNGYCGVEPSVKGCTPTDGKLATVIQYAWVKWCDTDTDCPRAGYSCRDPKLQGPPCRFCWPEQAELPPLLNCARPLWNVAQQPNPGCTSVSGAACTADEQCHTQAKGSCLSRLGGVALPDGYCSTLQGQPLCNPYPDAVIGFWQPLWLKACQVDEDCQIQKGLSCNRIHGACMPREQPILSITGDDPTGSYSMRKCFGPAN